MATNRSLTHPRIVIFLFYNLHLNVSIQSLPASVHNRSLISCGRCADPVFFFLFFFGVTCHLPGARDTSEQINERFGRSRATGATGDRVSNLCCQIAFRALANPSPCCNSFFCFCPGFPIHLSVTLFHFKVIDDCSFTLIICVSCRRVWPECPLELRKLNL